MKYKALSIVYPNGSRIAQGEKVIEVRSWQPPADFVGDLLIVENHKYLKSEGETDPNGTPVALAKIRNVRPFLETDMASACATSWAPGYYSWELMDVRPVKTNNKVLAARGLYELEWMDSELHQIVLFTDQKLDECESPYPFEDIVQHEWTMWLEEKNFRSPSQNRIQLVPVNSKADYDQMFEFMLVTEKSESQSDVETVKSFIKDISVMAKTFSGQWYLANFQNKIVGQIGIVPFQLGQKKIGRLKNVNIHPDFQGKGFGTELLALACEEARKQKLEALCLTADADNWPKDWYLKFGFIQVGEVRKG